jgi:FKBP-type peptidyl-prolyl cis-trans isomerase FkpA
MRAFLILFPAILMAQPPPPATKAAPAATKAAAPAAKSATPSTAAKSATAKAATPAAAPAALTTDDQKIVYAVGLSMAQQLSQLGLSRAELEIVKRALTDAAAGKPAVELSEWGPKINPFAQGRATKAAAAEKLKAKAFLDAAAAEPGATRAASGMVYRELAAGTGPSPKATDNVKANYRGTLIDGTEFDNSYKRNMPLDIGLNQVIRCWTEGMQKMKVGGKAKLVCPSDIAYGDAGRPGIPPGATLVFEIDLLGINPPNAGK